MGSESKVLILHCTNMLDVVCQGTILLYQRALKVLDHKVRKALCKS